jgi:DNA mismatch repair protein MutS
VPADTVRQARAYLARLDQFNARRDGQQDLFAAPEGATTRDAPGDARASMVLERLGALDPDALSPREALHALYELRRLLDAAGENPQTAQ